MNWYKTRTPRPVSPNGSSQEFYISQTHPRILGLGEFQAGNFSMLSKHANKNEINLSKKYRENLYHKEIRMNSHIWEYNANSNNKQIPR